jgi:hypothetical protein
MPTSSTSVVPVGTKVCKPFLVEVMVFSPESGYKFKVVVERSCTPEADPIWKLVFDLYTVTGSNEVQVVHVSFTSGTPVEQKGVQLMASEGVKPAQAQILTDEVHPAAKAVVGVKKPTAAQKKRLHDAMTKVVTVDVS